MTKKVKVDRLREVLQVGTFGDLGFYYYLRSRLRVNELFRCRDLGEELHLDSNTVYGRIVRLRKLGLISVVGLNCGTKITEFKL